MLWQRITETLSLPPPFLKADKSVFHFKACFSYNWDFSSSQNLAEDKSSFLWSLKANHFLINTPVCLHVLFNMGGVQKYQKDVESFLAWPLNSSPGQLFLWCKSGEVVLCLSTEKKSMVENTSSVHAVTLPEFFGNKFSRLLDLIICCMKCLVATCSPAQKWEALCCVVNGLLICVPKGTNYFVCFMLKHGRAAHQNSMNFQVFLFP